MRGSERLTTRLSELAGLFLAERVGFEPTVGSPLRLISSQVHSTTLPPLQLTVSRGTKRWILAHGLVRAKVQRQPQGLHPWQSLAPWLQTIHAPQVGAQDFGYGDAAVSALAILQHGHQGAAYSQA
jgi:hypothetical protein